MKFKIISITTLYVLVHTTNLMGFQKKEIYKNSFLELKEVLSIGKADGAEENWFNSICDIEVDSKGNIYVADEREQHVKVYNAKGKYFRTIGQKGGGPGRGW